LQSVMTPRLALDAVVHSLRRLAHRYRVDAVPPALLPPFLLYGHGVGLLLYAYFWLVRRSAVVVHEGQAALDPNENYIFCGWHQSLWPCLLTLTRAHPAQHVWLTNPDWYVKPVHVLLQRMGIELILGSTGRSGRQAADRLLVRLCQGASTVLAPDGPEGPAHHIHKGALHLSMQSGLPIVPLRFHCSRRVVLPGWDRQELPLPFCRITVRYGAPIAVESLDVATLALTAAL
jgi:lysophospholipid acyltransferase (LPLAT)-like uncharacterized protein